jgi:hypothetical protein
MNPLNGQTSITFSENKPRFDDSDDKKSLGEGKEQEFESIF